MRRLAFSLIASCGLAALAACSGGGFGTNLATGAQSKVPDQILFGNGSGSVQDFFVDPTGNSPILVNATGIKGTGASTVVIPDMTFQWSAVYAPAGTTYLKTASPNATGTCIAPPAGATGTITVGGTPSAGNTIFVTINGIPLSIAEANGATTATTAAAITTAINGNATLTAENVSASTSGSVVTVTASPPGGGANGYALVATTNGAGATVATSGPTLTGGAAPVDSLLQQGPGGNAYPNPNYGNGNYSQLNATPQAPFTFAPNYTGLAATIFVGPPVFANGTIQQPTTATTGNYCLRLIATDPNSGRQGSTVIVISQSP